LEPSPNLSFNLDRAKRVLDKYAWFLLTNFAKFVNGVGIGQEGITINIPPEYVEMKVSGNLLSPDRFFEMFDQWQGNKAEFLTNPLAFKQREYDRTGDIQYASSYIQFPESIEGIPINLKVTGRYVPLIFGETFEDNYPQPYQQYARPFPGGYSIGHIEITAGTFTCVVWDKKTGKRVLLSNKHVFSPMVQGIIPTTRCIGDPKEGDYITQPGPKDIELQNLGPKENFIVGRFLRQGSYDKWYTGKSNKVDSAIAEIIRDRDVLNEIYEFGRARDVVEPQVGMQLKLMGRTSGPRNATIEQVNFWVPLCTCSDEYLGGLNPNCCIPTPILMCIVPGPDVRIMTDLFDTSQGTAYPGDSGSVAVTMDNKYVGQLFGGDTMLHKGVCSKASNIEKVLDVSFNETWPQPSPLGIVALVSLVLGSSALGYYLLKKGLGGTKLSIEKVG